MDQRSTNKPTPWILTRSGVLVMLFLVTGALGLPLLFKSPAFSRNEKTALAIAVSLYTIALIAAFAWCVMYIFHMAQRLVS